MFPGQDEWRAARRFLNRSRAALARAAAELYPASVRCGSVPLLAGEEWITRSPLRLEEVALDWAPEAAGSLVTGGEPEADGVLPLRAPGERYPRYTAVIADLDPPRLFENRPSYRLLDIDLAGSPRLTFGAGTYFDKLDVGEAVAHELAVAKRKQWSWLPLRSLVGDPFDLRRRSVPPAIETLTLRRNRSSGLASFLLLRRDPAKVATTAGLHGLVPAGEFQPAGDPAIDLDLRHTIVREYAEELLGEPERHGEPADYAIYQHVLHADVFFLGVGLDALTLTATILTVAVFDSDAFDDAFGAAVQVNAEGTLATADFTADNLRRLLREEPMASPAAYILDRAWRSRDRLLATG